MKILIALALAFSVPASLAAKAPTETSVKAARPGPITVEYYYRIKWGSKEEFLTLYRLNHEPLLHDMQKQGWITEITTVEPALHMAGDQRWDLRVTLTYRDGESAVGDGSGYDSAAEAATRRRYPDKATHDAAEARRMSLLEEHWDVLLKPVVAH
jgi:hypothetical protein